MEIWIGIIGTIAGGIVAWALGESSKALAERRKSRCDLRAAVFVCLGRLLRIKSAHSLGLHDQIKHEFWLLGADMDRYQHCIALGPSKRAPHWVVYKKMIGVLQKEDVEGIDLMLAELESVSGATSQEG